MVENNNQDNVLKIDICKSINFSLWWECVIKST